MYIILGEWSVTNPLSAASDPDALSVSREGYRLPTLSYRMQAAEKD
jgi:hypothetical protein